MNLQHRDRFCVLHYFRGNRAKLIQCPQLRRDGLPDGRHVIWRGVQVNPNVRYTYRVLAAALALSGQLEEARAVGAEMLRRYPKETISAFLKREPWPDSRYRAGQNLEVTRMRLAGIPE